MTGMINFAGGLAAAGASVADTAGMLSKAELEKQKDQLAQQFQKDMQQGQFAQQDKTVATQEAGATARTNITEAGATARTNITETGANARSAAEIAAHHEDVKTSEAGATARNAASIAAQNNELNFDADGNAIVVNKETGKSTPLVGADGKSPLKIANPAQAKFASDAINATRDDLRWTTSQYDADVRQAQANIDALHKNGAPADDPDMQAAQKRLDDVQKQYAPHIQELQQRLQGLASSLMNRASIPGSPAATPTAAPSKTASLPVPAAFAGKPNGTVLSKGGTNYVIQDGKLVPQ